MKSSHAPRPSSVKYIPLMHASYTSVWACSQITLSDQSIFVCVACQTKCCLPGPDTELQSDKQLGGPAYRSFQHLGLLTYSAHLATSLMSSVFNMSMHTHSLTTSLAFTAKGVDFREDLKRKEEESVREPLSRCWALIRRRMAFTVARNSSVWSIAPGECGLFHKHAIEVEETAVSV